MLRITRFFFALVAVSACASGSGSSSAASDRPLAWTVPATPSLAYEVADTTAISMDIMGNAIRIDGNAFAALQLDFATAGDRVRTTVRFRELRGEFANSMGPTETLSQSDMPGPATVEVGARGDVRLTDVPAMTPTAAQILGPQSAYKRLFIPLPGRVVANGAGWVDTIQVSDDAGGMSSTTTLVVTSVLHGDTTVDGRRLRVIRSDAEVTTRVAGTNQGVELRQNLNGTSTGLSLWDPALNGIVLHDESTTMTGTMELPAMNLSGIPVVYQNQQRMRLVR
ncbi:MAG: hypothetical protein L0271_00310 [Gemmatimonadetes bacterium]|nr:hypothetical protein [Gemmatimonadota bacterium]